MCKRIAFFVGSATAFNTQFDTVNMGKMLSNDFDLHLITTDETYEDQQFTQYYQVFGTERPKTLRGSVRAVRSYLESEEPNVIMNISKPTKHGLLLGTLCSNHSTAFVYRYPGDNFNFYKICKGWRKPSYFVLNNIICRPGVHMADEYVALGPYGKNELTKLRVPEETISVLPTPVDCTRLKGAQSELDLGIDADASVILFVGRLVRTKGTDILRRVIPKVLDRRDDIHFLIVGPGEFPEVPEVTRDHVTLTGAVPPESIGQYYERADVLVLPSYSEGLPRVLLEGLCMDTRLITSSVGDIPSVTSNTFETEQEFVDMICGYESLPLEDVDPFTLGSLQPKYVKFFERVTERQKSE